MPTTSIIPFSNGKIMLFKLFCWQKYKLFFKTANKSMKKIEPNLKDMK